MSRKLLGALLPAVVLITLQAGESGGRAHYVGGTVAELSGKSDGHIQTTDSDTMLFVTRRGTMRVPYSEINLIEYGQRVSRRYAEAILISPLMMLSKKRTHFLTVGFSDPGGRQQAMIFEVSKGDIRTVLVTLEARTGRKVEFQDEEARKAGKG